MSTYDPTLVKTVYEFFVGNYCSITSNVFYIYDCLLTLDDEVEFFWKRPFTGATALFLFNRYLALADVLTLFFSWSGQNAWYSDAAAWYNNDRVRICAIDERITLAIVYLQLLPPAVFSCLRAFALSKSWPLAMLVLVLALVPYGVNMADYGYNVTGVPDSIFGCALSDTEPMHISIIFTILSRTCLIVQDAILLIITWARLYRRHVFGGILRRLTFESVLLQDGESMHNWPGLGQLDSHEVSLP
ncbi:hypothetical protein BD309DRAFT_1053160 [Dichomitus squalens]|nr:hypothetical protein BD309DRAFT_1053160 [Dichomitus squalens]